MAAPANGWQPPMMKNRGDDDAPKDEMAGHIEKVVSDTRCLAAGGRKVSLGSVLVRLGPCERRRDR